MKSEGLPARADVPLGIMIEVPAAASAADIAIISDAAHTTYGKSKTTSEMSLSFFRSAKARAASSLSICITP